ncbi:hypothetical protein [Gluconobacter sp. P1C6_b]|uniref:hypothetical protein n=1 Tax=Gluconobacter sp. P1C6_b TaxID=2762619 RepID=UPI00207B2847|nr:hypothetical protein [Gluconobacter sp. P1C6_b]
MTRQFPYMKSNFLWKGDDFILTPEALANPKNKYHGLERLALEHHAAGDWRLAGEYWLIAAGWRRNMMDPENERHVEYDRALADWKKKKLGRNAMPYPSQFGLSDD